MTQHTPGPWLRTDKTVYSLMHHGWRKGVEELKNRFAFSFSFDADVNESERAATSVLMQRHA